MLDVKILTAYPEMFPGSLEHSLIGKALKKIFSKYQLLTSINLALMNE